jgi:hypothetical protein
LAAAGAALAPPAVVPMGRCFGSLLPVRINFGSWPAGACGAMIFWKHVGHSMVVPLCEASHRMCWPQWGQAYLNSLMTAATIPLFPPHGNPTFRVWECRRSQNVAQICNLPYRGFAIRKGAASAVARKIVPACRMQFGDTAD